jgi:dihydrofolate reductase
MRLVVSEFVTLDGVMEDPGGAEGFEHGGWQMPFFDEAMGAAVQEGLFAADALLLGRVTYEHFAAAWPSMTDTGEFGERMNGLPKHVATRTLTEPTWNATFLQGEVPDAVAALKQQPGGNLLVMGSGTLVGTLRQHGLVDEYQLFVHPVVLGGGKRLFEHGFGKTDLRLADSRTTGTGVVIATYQAGG